MILVRIDFSLLYFYSQNLCSSHNTICSCRQFSATDIINYHQYTLQSSNKSNKSQFPLLVLFSGCAVASVYILLMHILYSERWRLWKYNKASFFLYARKFIESKQFISPKTFHPKNTKFHNHYEFQKYCYKYFQ